MTRRALGLKVWAKDEDYLTSSLRLAQRPTVNIQGLVSGYMGPGGKSDPSRPGRSQARPAAVPGHDVRGERWSKLKVHLAKRGYGDIEVNVSGGYSPNETAEDSVLIRAE